MFGAGKYDDLCTVARTTAEAEGAVLIIFNGNLGSGFSAQVNLEMLLRLPQILRETANLLEADASNMKYHG